MRRILSLLRQRCPRCETGSPFSGLIRMHAACPVCGLQFEREPGYWMGSLYVNYAIALALCLPLIVLLALAKASVPAIVAATTIELVLLSPVIIRYARLIWMYIDQAIDPR